MFEDVVVIAICFFFKISFPINPWYLISWVLVWMVLHGQLSVGMLYLALELML
jgi:hypothetical protein